ncbi:hypothetical protein [Tunturiibacter gelidiferens]|uniref:hypothetical protein n=1 Tax=Tunturiibacter gelidiferens TaxID=3069689 RepID=UPI003D9B686F
MSVSKEFASPEPTPQTARTRLFCRTISRVAALFLPLLPLPVVAQIDTTSVAPHRYLVVYRNATIPGDAEAHVVSSGARLTQRNEHLGIAAVQSPASQDDATTLRLLSAQPNVSYVLHDRIVSALRLRLRPIAVTARISNGAQSLTPITSLGRLPTHGPITSAPLPPNTTPSATASSTPGLRHLLHLHSPGMGRPAGRRLRKQRPRRPRTRPLGHHHGQRHSHRHHRQRHR